MSGNYRKMFGIDFKMIGIDRTVFEIDRKMFVKARNISGMLIRNYIYTSEAHGACVE